MSRAIETLMTEHRTIEQVLSALESVAQAVRDGATCERREVARFAEFFRMFADFCHHGKEEKILFEEMVRAGVPVEGGPIGCMLHEHDEGRAQVREIATIGGRLGSLTDQERSRLYQASTRFIELLRQHIRKEDEILYPMAERALSKDLLDAMAVRFDAFDRDVMGMERHRKMMTLARDLSQLAIER